MAKCEGKSKRTGQPCRAQALTGSHFCMFHGGRTPIGPAHPNYVHGRRSKYREILPASLRDGYEKALIDPELLSMRHEIAVVDAKIEETMKRAATAETAAAWDALKGEAARFRAAQRAKDGAATAQAISAMLALVERGMAGAGVWPELERLFVLRQKLVSDEHDRRREIENAMGPEQALAMLRAIQDIVLRNVTDTPTRMKIGREFNALLEAMRGRARALPEPIEAAAP